MSRQFRFPRPGAVSTLKRAGPLAAVLTACLVLAPAASSAGTYTDPAGDNATAADITGLTVSGDKGSGQLTFRISGTNISSSDDLPTLLFIDSDANPLTGNLLDVGADYVFEVDHGSYGFARWNGSDWVDTSYATVRVIGMSQGVLISVNKTEIGNTSDVNFWARSYDMVGKKFDDAPNDGVFNYSIDADGPLITSVDVQTSPSSGPRAGKAFVITPTAVHLPPDGALNASRPPDSYSCSAAKLGAKTLTGSGTGNCTFRIPKKKAKGKTLTVTLTASYQGGTKNMPLSFTVR